MSKRPGDSGSKPAAPPPEKPSGAMPIVSFGDPVEGAAALDQFRYIRLFGLTVPPGVADWELVDAHRAYMRGQWLIVGEKFDPDYLLRNFPWWFARKESKADERRKKHAEIIKYVTDTGDTNAKNLAAKFGMNPRTFNKVRFWKEFRKNVDKQRRTGKHAQTSEDPDKDAPE